MPEEIIPEEEPIATPTAERIKVTFEEKEAVLSEKENLVKLGAPKLRVEDVQREDTKKNLALSKKAIVDDVKKIIKKTI